MEVLESMGGHAIGRKELSFWNEFNIAISSLQGYCQYLSLALPGIFIVSEWWASEAAIFLSGHLLPSPELALGGKLYKLRRLRLYQSCCGSYQK